MKKTIPLILIAILIIGGILYWRKPKTVVQNNTNGTVATTTDQNTNTPPVTTKSYKSSNLGISFQYPSNLSASTTGTSVTLHHEVAFSHSNYCDFKGDGPEVLPNLTDFNATFKVVNKDLVSAMKSESPYIPAENFVNGKVVPSPGFIDPYTSGSLSGYQIFEGAEGCGHTIYYLKVSDNKTLVVTNDLITVFSGAINQSETERAKQVSGIILPDSAQTIFNNVIKTVQVQ